MNLPQAKTALTALGLTVAGDGDVLYKGHKLGWLSLVEPVTLAVVGGGPVPLEPDTLQATVETYAKIMHAATRGPSDAFFELHIRLLSMK